MFDAVITDIRMPDMNGLELLKEIKRHDESVEVVVMTGYPTIASAVEALKEGAFDYLSKPLLLDELRHLMTRMTERRFLRGEVHSLRARLGERSEEHTSELQSPLNISYAVFCLKKKK